MSILGDSDDDLGRNCTDLWREKFITERAFALIAAKEWPPPIGWIDDLLRRDWIPPDGDFWEALRRERPARLVCRDGVRVDE